MMMMRQEIKLDQNEKWSVMSYGEGVSNLQKKIFYLTNRQGIICSRNQ